METLVCIRSSCNRYQINAIAISRKVGKIVTVYCFDVDSVKDCECLDEEMKGEFGNLDMRHLPKMGTI